MLQRISKVIASLVLAFCLFAVSMPAGADHVVFIDFNFTDAPGTGFLDPVLGAPPSHSPILLPPRLRSV